MILCVLHSQPNTLVAMEPTELGVLGEHTTDECMQLHNCSHVYNHWIDLFT